MKKLNKRITGKEFAQRVIDGEHLNGCSEQDKDNFIIWDYCNCINEMAAVVLGLKQEDYR